MNAELLQNQTQGKRRFIRKGIQIGVISLIFFFLGRNLYYHREELVSYPWELNPLYLAASFISSVACAFLVALGWNLILRSLGQRVSHWRALRIYFLSELGRYLPGKVWSFVGRVYLAAGEGVPKVVTTASIGVQFLIQLIAAMTVALLSLPFWSSLELKHYDYLYLLFLVIPLGLLVLHPAIFNPLIDFVLVKFKKVRLEAKLRYRPTLLLVIYWIGMWFLKGAATFFLLRAIYHQPLPPASFSIMIGLIALSWTIANLSFLAPAGLGVLEGLLYAFLKNLFHLSPGITTVFVLLSRVWQTGVELICVALVIFVNYVIRARLPGSAPGGNLQNPDVSRREPGKD